MPRRNHPRRDPHGRNLSKPVRVGGKLDELADREKRAMLIQSWVNQHSREIRDRWNWYRKAGTNKSPKQVIVICHECDHYIRPGEGICTAQYDAESPRLSFHWKRGELNCWTRFLERKVREAAEHALFGTKQEIA